MGNLNAGLEEKVSNEKDADKGAAAFLNPLLRESAVVLAAIAGLLYIASHVYGMNFLDTFGVRNGFHGVGFSHLSMIPMHSYAVLALIIWATHSAITQEGWKWLFPSIPLIFLSFSAKELLHNIYCGFDWSLPFSVLWSLFVIAPIFLINRRITPVQADLLKRSRDLQKDIYQLRARIRANSQALDDQAAELEKEAQIASGDLPMENKINELKVSNSQAKRQHLEMANISESHIAQVNSQIERIQRSQRWFSICAWSLAGLIAIHSTLPALATVEAIAAAQDDEFVETTAGSATPRPVYWVGDRVVYLTQEGSQCFAHSKIADNEISKRKCPALITAAIALD